MIKLVKVNSSLVIVIVVLAFIGCLFPIGFGALAIEKLDDASSAEIPNNNEVLDSDIGGDVVNSPEESNATDVSNKTDSNINKNNEVNERSNAITQIELACDDYGKLYTLDNKRTFELKNGDKLICNTEETNVDHTGYMFIVKEDGTKICIAAAFSPEPLFGSEYFKFYKWESSPTGSANNTKYTANFTQYDPAEENCGYYAANIYSAGFLNNGKPLESADFTWVSLQNGEKITKKSNNFGYVCLKVPFDVPGIFYVEKAGFVTEYSDYITMSTSNALAHTDVILSTGSSITIKNNSEDAKFHIREWYNSGSRPILDARLTSDTYLYEIPNRTFINGGELRILSNDECDKNNLVHNTLYYCKETGFGGSYYEITFEPCKDLDVDNWTQTNALGKSEIFKSGDVFLISPESNHSVFQLNYLSPINPTEPNEPTITETAQTGDDNLPIVITLIVVICACGGFIVYRKIKKK